MYYYCKEFVLKARANDGLPKRGLERVALAQETGPAFFHSLLCMFCLDTVPSSRDSARPWRVAVPTSCVALVETALHPVHLQPCVATEEEERGKGGSLSLATRFGFPQNRRLPEREGNGVYLLGRARHRSRGGVSARGTSYERNGVHLLRPGRTGRNGVYLLPGRDAERGWVWRLDRVHVGVSAIDCVCLCVVLGGRVSRSYRRRVRGVRAADERDGA